MMKYYHESHYTQLKHNGNRKRISVQKSEDHKTLMLFCLGTFRNLRLASLDIDLPLSLYLEIFEVGQLGFCDLSSRMAEDISDLPVELLLLVLVAGQVV
jgi:hypothetical protein